MERAGDYYRQSRAELLPFLPPTVRKLLDVGCGEGNFGLLVKERWGAEVWGIEINPAAAAAAQAKIDRVLVGDVQELLPALAAADFDCLVFADVLEHLVDPFQVLQQAKNVLAPMGSLLITIPNVLYIKNLYNLLYHKDWRYEPQGILDISHLRFFTKKSFSRTLQELDFHIEEVRGINPCRQRVLWFLFNFLTVGHFHESQYLQLVFRARPN